MPSVARRYATSQQPFERPSARSDAEGRAPVVLMVSGGADSTALLVLAATSRLDIDDGRGRSRIARERLHVLHINHQLRGIDAEEDEEFVRELASRYGIPCTVERVDVASIARDGADGNVENVARIVRYTAANRIANELSEEWGTPRSAARIVTAHTANDRAETFLMNAIKGTGPQGLSSIPRRRNRIVRPLLDRTHEELCEFLRMNGVVWREDATNADTRYLRAFVRHEVLPLAEQRNPRVVESLSTTCDILSDEDSYLTQVATRTLRDLTRRSGQGMLALDAGRLAALDVAVARRVVRLAILSVEPAARLESRHVAGVLALVANGEGSATVPLGVDARVEFGLLFVRARISSGEPVSGWLEVPGRIALASGDTIEARVITLAPGQNPIATAVERTRDQAENRAVVDAQAVGLDAEGMGRLWVDAPQPGDVLCPFGMHGQSKKLSDLLRDEGVPAADKPLVPVVRTAPTGSCVWVGGFRLDERARCTPATRVLVELSLHRTSDNRG